MNSRRLLANKKSSQGITMIFPKIMKIIGEKNNYLVSRFDWALNG
jgi:hypothetical protein